ncbi:hypothetical protein DSCA_32280 [Desulfosarcina alkanivorans]|uniref:Peptidase C1A papain C-terminal domain-containing protein n=1 Tax=Desulfosarcina alkanivorans TaxID=571177 RepID=A0A5K7YK86_9BACT|nr:hypothetical protein [Desulfosarcina alkanivorans]BBO69298.1 hypothetical protein DSCA_32280 [Desulfosarcina alkanivorans]
MVWGAKFWHGNMTAKQVFPLTNPYTQDSGGSQGICTAASLAWCKAVLKKGSAVNAWAEMGVSEHTLNIQMRTLRRLDSQPREQTELAGLVPVGNDHNASLIEVIRIIETTAPFIGIFWTAGHTMGYRYAHHQKEFFDMEQGLFRAKYTAGVRAKIEEHYAGAVIGCRVVNLPA